MSATELRKLLDKNKECLTRAHLTGFQKYKYSSIDTNPIGVYVMHPFWNWLIKFFPTWLAPNLITLIGFLFIVKSFLLLSYYDYYFYASSNAAPDYSPIPRWVFLDVSLSIFISYTLDGIDGKQARRTKTSGPLGELFDHGLDSWTTVFIPVLLYSIFGRLDFSIPPFRAYFICVAVFVNFFLAHVEKYNSGILYLPWSYDISMLSTVILFFITFLIGHNGWKFNIAGTAVSIGVVLECFFYLTTVAFSLPMLARGFISYYYSRSRDLCEALRPLIPLVYFLVLSYVWLSYSPTNVIERDPRIFCMTCGNIFSNICCRLIISQMTSTRCQVFNFLFIPLGIALLVSVAIPPLELTCLYLLFVTTTYFHLYYGTTVVRQMCDHFKIKCFTIPARKD